MALLRRLGLYLLSSGATQAEVMEDLAVSRTTAWKWACALRQGASGEAVAAATPVLSDAARDRLPALVARGPGPYGFSNGRWTMARLTIMFEVEFGMCCSTLQVFQLLGDLAPLPNQRGRA